MAQQKNKHSSCICVTSNTVTDFSNGEVLCGSCGVVFNQSTTDFSHESRSINPEDYLSKNRTGPTSKNTIADSLSSKIAHKNTDSSGRLFSPATKQDFNRLRMWDSRTKSNSKSRSLARALVHLNGLKDKLGLSDFISENAASMYRKASEKNMIRGNSVESMVAASVYAACRNAGIPRSLDDVAKSANITRKTLSRCYRVLLSGLNIKFEATTSVDYVNKIASSVNATEKAKRIAYKILNDFKDTRKHVGKNPVGLASAALYISSLGTGHNIAMQGFSLKNNISTVTIRKMRKLLMPFAAKYIESIDV